jgi:hypothetical protein
MERLTITLLGSLAEFSKCVIYDLKSIIALNAYLF